MALAATLDKRHQLPGVIVAQCNVVASSTYPTGGDPVDFQTCVGMTNRQPDYVIICGKAGFVYQYDYANKKMFVYCNTAGGANGALGEHTAAAYAAGVSGDTIVAFCVWISTPGLT